jgi:hypothetical protein
MEFPYFIQIEKELEEFMAGKYSFEDLLSKKINFDDWQKPNTTHKLPCKYFSKGFGDTPTRKEFAVIVNQKLIVQGPEGYRVYILTNGSISTLLVPTNLYNIDCDEEEFNKIFSKFGSNISEYELHKHDSNNGLDFLPLNKKDFTDPIYFDILCEFEIPMNKRWTQKEGCLYTLLLLEEESSHEMLTNYFSNQDIDRRYFLYPFETLKTKYLPIAWKEDRITIQADPITTLDQKKEFREMLVLLKRFLKFHCDADILRMEVEEKLLD